MSKILYTCGTGLYINLTNRCPCNCEFCIRRKFNGYGSADNLWLENEASVDEILTELKRFKIDTYSELVLCGYGEPCSALSVLVSLCSELKKITSLPIRVNTNGLGNLINNTHVPPLLSKLVDTVSVSLNTSDPNRYLKMCKPIYGKIAYPSMLSFAIDCKKYISKVQFTVLDIIGAHDIDRCHILAKKLGIELRVRKIISSEMS